MKSIKPIIVSGIVAGILDCISAVVFLGKMNFAGVWKYVASGYFGKSAFSSGNEMVVYGLLFHFCIAIFWAIVFFFVVRKINFFKHYIIVGGLLYGIMIWLVMNLIVLPFTNIPQNPMTAIGAIKNIVILMLCVGLPISWIQNKLKTNDN
jgi:hypothetical protein